MSDQSIGEELHGYGYRLYGVQSRSRAPLIQWMVEALQSCGCCMIHVPEPGKAPFRLTFETPLGERMGILAYAFLANRKETRNRPSDEYRFQLKYGVRDGLEHEIWQDPYGLYTTLLLGIDPVNGFFVGVDPVLHSPTKMFISIEFKDHHAEQILDEGWHVWERSRQSSEEPVEVMVGGTADSFLRFIRFEREALREAQGHRHYLAERFQHPLATYELAAMQPSPALVPPRDHLHALAAEFELEHDEIFNLISEAPRLRMAVRGWVAEEHLYRQLLKVPGVSGCRRLNDEGRPDIELRYREGAPLLVECKNVARKTTKDKLCRLDFQRTRAAKSDPCSRYYSPQDFDVVAACLHAVTESWEYRFCPTGILAPHAKCTGKLSSNVRVDQQWTADAVQVFEMLRDGTG